MLPSDGVEAPVNAVDEVHVGNTRCAIERTGSLGQSWSGRVARGIVLAEVCLGFHDAPRRDSLGRSAPQHRAQELARDDLRLTVVEGRGERLADTRTPRRWRGVSCHPSPPVAAGFFARPRGGRRRFDFAALLSDAALAAGSLFPFRAVLRGRGARRGFATGSSAAASGTMLSGGAPPARRAPAAPGSRSRGSSGTAGVPKSTTPSDRSSGGSSIAPLVRPPRERMPRLNDAAVAAERPA